MLPEAFGRFGRQRSERLGAWLGPVARRSPVLDPPLGRQGLPRYRRSRGGLVGTPFTGRLGDSGSLPKPLKCLVPRRVSHPLGRCHTQKADTPAILASVATIARGRLRLVAWVVSAAESGSCGANKLEIRRSGRYAQRCFGGVPERGLQPMEHESAAREARRAGPGPVTSRKLA